MSFASDKLYDGYLRKNMPRIVTKVKPTQIMAYLPCLTDHDRENIEAKKDACGSFDAMVKLLDCMKRRENWPEEFIAALEACEHRILAAEIRTEYDTLRGINNSPSAPPAANVVTAHVHPAPSAPHLPEPEPAASAEPSQSIQPEATVAQPIQETETPQSTPAPMAVIELTTPPEQPKTQTEAVVVPPATPPPSPDSAQVSGNPSPPPEQETFITHQEPEENLEPETLPALEVLNEVNVNQRAEEYTESLKAPEPQLEPCEVVNPVMEQPAPITKIAYENTPIDITVKEPTVVEPQQVEVVREDTIKPVNIVDEVVLPQTDTDSPSDPSADMESSLGRSVSPLTNLDDLILKAEKPPVQETSPIDEKPPTVVTMLEETSDPQNTQDEILQNIEVQPTLPAEVDSDTGSSVQNYALDDNKPGVPVSVEPPDQNNTTMRPPTPEYSGDSGRIMISEDVPPCQENCFNLHSQDKEVSEFPAPSHEEYVNQENIGLVAEEVSILNKEIPTQFLDSDEFTEEVNIVQAVAFPTLSSDPEAKRETATPNLDVESNSAQPVAFSTLSSDPSLTTAPEAKQKTATSNLDVDEVSEDPVVEEIVPATTLIEEITYLNVDSISESPATSLDMDDVRVNIGHVAEDPSILNLQQPLHETTNQESHCEIKTSLPQIEDKEDVNFMAIPTGAAEIKSIQTPLIQVNGEPAQEVAPVPPNCNPNCNTSVNDVQQPIDPKQPDSGMTSHSLNGRYILTAAGVGACALLIAWRFRH